MNGALPDNRSDEQKKKDYTFKEVVAAAAPVNWIEKSDAEIRKFPDQQQDGSGSCVAQTIKKLALVNLFNKEKSIEVFSATFIYQQRSNKPSSGMIGVEAFDIWANTGITLESLLSSENMDDAAMDAMKVEQYEKDVAAIFKIKNHVGWNAPSSAFEEIASVIQQTGKGVMTWFYFTSPEWSLQFPTVQTPGLALADALKHSVAAVDFCLRNGKKYLVIEDSAHFGGLTRRFISEEFFAARCWFARYAMSFQFDAQTITKPHYVFSKVLEFGITDPDVKALQDILKFEGLFPSNTESTGYYGAITAKALLQWQIAHAVASTDELNQLAGRRVGPKTINVLNSIYGQ